MELKVKTGIIYKYTSPRNLIYIGQTINPELRQDQHKSGTSKEDCKFGKEIRMYGWLNFKYDILESVFTDDDITKFLDDRESFWIKKFRSFNNGLNGTIGNHVIRIEDDEALEKLPQD